MNTTTSASPDALSQQPVQDPEPKLNKQAPEQKTGDTLNPPPLTDKERLEEQKIFRLTIKNRIEFLKPQVDLKELEARYAVAEATIIGHNIEMYKMRHEVAEIQNQQTKAEPKENETQSNDGSNRSASKVVSMESEK